jgi:hypothetical protein
MPTLVPTMVTSAEPKPKTMGIQQIFQAHAHTIASQGKGAKGTNRAGEQGDVQVGEDGVE